MSAFTQAHLHCDEKGCIAKTKIWHDVLRGHPEQETEKVGWLLTRDPENHSMYVYCPTHKGRHKRSD